MITLLLMTLLSLSLLQSPPQTDEIVEIGEAKILEVNPFSYGTVTITAWDRDEVHVAAFHSSEISIEIQKGRSRIKVEERRPARAALEKVRLHIKAPRSFRLRVVGRLPKVDIQGMEGPIHVSTNQGDVRLRNVKGEVRLRSSGGALEILDSQASMKLKTTSNRIVVRNCDGEVEAETVAGDIQLIEVRSRRLTATSNAGSIRFEGALRDDGFYDLASDKGNIEIHLPEMTNAAVKVGTVSGSFRSDFPLGEVVPIKGEHFRFDIGSASAELSLTTFRGDIRIIKVDGPGSFTKDEGR